MTETTIDSVLPHGDEVPDLREKLDSFVHDTGYQFYTYISGRVVAGRRITNFDPREKPFHLTNVPQAWESQYSRKRYSDHDPLMLFALSNMMPEHWSEIVRNDNLTPRQKRIVSDAEDIGLRNGLIVPVHGPGGEFAVLSLSHSETVKQQSANVSGDDDAIHMFALRFHNAVRKLRGTSEMVPAVSLTTREIDVMFWTAEGKSTWDISQILGISEATVNFHIGSAKRKLGVYSKPHAVAKMYTLSERSIF